MKKISLLSLFALLILLSSCIQDKCEQTVTYTALEPVYMSYEEMRSGISTEGPRDLHKPGKMYYRGSYLFISEVNEGVHVINNTDPSNPVNEAFIRIPGNHDLAVKGNILYADSYVDLVALDISNPLQVRVLSREEEVFPYEITWPVFQAANGIWYPLLQPDPALGVVKEWRQTEYTETIDCNQYGPTRGGISILASMDLSSGNIWNESSSAANTVDGVGGSLARFAIVGDRMYAVTLQQLLLFNLDAPDKPTFFREVDLGFGIETIFPYQQNLFIGSQTGVFIYDISNPNSPEYLSEFVHVRNCDPVAVEGDYAYVTLRTGTGCGGSQNVLEVLDIRNLSNPQLIATYQMVNPAGVGIRNNVLFLCDGSDGLKVFDATDPFTITNHQLQHYQNVQALDVIPLDGILLMIGEDGFFQYNYEDLSNIYLMSTIPVVK